MIFSNNYIYSLPIHTLISIERRWGLVMSPGFLVCIWLYDADWMFRLLWQRLFPLVTVLPLLRLDFFSPDGPAVNYVHYLVCPYSDLSLFLFSAEKDWNILQLRHRKVCSCMCRLLWMVVLSKDHCMESWGHVHQTAKWKRLTQGQFSSSIINIIFSLSEHKHRVVDLCSQKIIYCVCMNSRQQTSSFVHPNK